MGAEDAGGSPDDLLILLKLKETKKGTAAKPVRHKAAEALLLIPPDTSYLYLPIKGVLYSSSLQRSNPTVQALFYIGTLSQ